MTVPIILIGGNGFLGGAFKTHLEARHQPVHVIGRRDWESGAADDLANSVAGRQSRIVDFAYDTIPSSSFDDPVRDFTANLGTMIRHLEFAKRIGAERHVFVSSGGTVYGDQGDRPIAEDAPKQPISPYGITKLASEHYAAMYLRLGVPTVVARPANIYGPGQLPFRGQGLVATAFGAALQRKSVTLFGDGSQQRDYLYVDDFCTGLDSVVERGAVGEAYNIGSGIPTTASDLLSAISEITSRDGFRLSTTHAAARPFDVNSNILDITKLSRMLGWQPSCGLDEGLERTWSWIRSRRF